MFPSSRHPDRTRQPAPHILALQPLKQPSNSPAPSCHPHHLVRTTSLQSPLRKDNFPTERRGIFRKLRVLPSHAWESSLCTSNAPTESQLELHLPEAPGEQQVLQALCPRRTSPSAGNVLPITDLGHCPQWCPHRDPQTVPVGQCVHECTWEHFTPRSAGYA